MTTIKILIVEDLLITALDLKQSLEEEGYEVTAIARTGIKAIQSFKEIQPDLVLIDIGLRGNLDGIQTVEKLNKIQKVPIIYLTAYKDEKTITRAMQTHPSFYLIKPFSMPQLAQDIEKALTQFYSF